MLLGEPEWTYLSRLPLFRRPDLDAVLYRSCWCSSAAVNAALGMSATWWGYSLFDIFLMLIA